MARGGKREGAGRKPNSETIKSREVAKSALISGKKTPLEVMLEAMHYAMEQVDSTKDPMAKKIFYESAHAHAKDAAPYMHAKLANVELQALDKNGNKADNVSKIVIEHVSAKK